jgi:hypothetical protein
VPVRFQVDPDFYDHPKTIGMSDEATALWVRAGSYSAAKLTDGFINEYLLVSTLRSSMDAAEELVRRGLWRRRKGGFQFHQWEARNLEKARVEAERAADRTRKRKNRLEGKQHANSQVDTRFVRPDSGRSPDGLSSESDRSPECSVLVSVSESSKPPKAPKGASRRRYDYNDDETFGRFWSAYPEKKGKPAAYQAWLKALERGADPERVITAAATYRDDPRRNPEKTKYPQGWLTDERYLEVAQAEQAAPRGWWDN